MNQNLRISELPPSIKLKLDDLLAISTKIGNSSEWTTKKINIETLINGIDDFIDFKDIINKYLSEYLFEMTGEIRRVYLGDEELDIKDGVLRIPDKTIPLIENINTLNQNYADLLTTVNELDIEITNLKNYVDNDFKKQIIRIIEEMIRKAIGFLEMDVKFNNNLRLEGIFIKKEISHTILQANRVFTKDETKFSFELPSNEPGTYLIFDMDEPFFKNVLPKFTESVFYETTINTEKYFFPVFVNTFFNNTTRKLIFFFKNAYDFEGILIIK